MCVCVCGAELDEKQDSSNIEEHLVQEYKQWSYYKQTRAELEQITQGLNCDNQPKSRTITYNTSFNHQFKWVLKRTFRNLMLNPQTSFAQVLNNISLIEFICRYTKVSGFYFKFIDYKYLYNNVTGVFPPMELHSDMLSLLWQQLTQELERFIISA